MSVEASRRGRPASSGDDRLWAAVDALVDRAPSLADLRSHRLEPFAIRRLRARGLPVPADLLEEERRAAIAVLAAPVLLERVQEAYDGEVITLKGPDVAELYPDPVLRPYRDLDLLVRDAPAAQAALVAAGFEEVGDPAEYVDIHHLRPLRSPGLPLVVEIHSRPKWVDAVQPPPTEELFAAALPESGRLRHLPPAHHALVLAVHSWAHEPLRRLRDMVDVAVMAEAAGRAEVATLARAWGLERLWRATSAAVDAVLWEREPSLPLRLWAQNLEKVRERTVFENHAQRWLSDFSIMPFGSAAARLPATVAREFLPKRAEGWPAKLVRMLRALRNAGRSRSHHHDELDRRRRR